MKPPNTLSLVELHRLVLHVGMPAPNFTFEEVEAAKAELDRQLIVLENAANKLNLSLSNIEIRGTPAELEALFENLREEEEDIKTRFAFLFELRGFIVDFMILLSPNFHTPEQRAAAVEQMVERMMENAVPADPAAWAALPRAAAIHDKRPKDILREAITTAVWLVALQTERPETIREGRERWVRDSVGKVTEVIPARQYGPGSEQFQHWFELRVRPLVEEQILALARQQPVEKRKKTYEPIEDHEIVGAEGIPNPVMATLGRMLTPKDRALLERAELDNLDATDRKRLERLRLRFERFRKVL